MADQSQCFVAGVLAIGLRVSRFAGIAPLRFQKEEKGWRVKLSPCLSLGGYCIVTITNLIFIWSLMEERREAKWYTYIKRNFMQNVVWVLDALMAVLVVSMMIYGAPGQMRRLIACLIQIQKINAMMNIDYWPSQCTKKQIAFYIFWGTANIIIVIGHIVTLIILNAEASGIWMLCMYSMYYGVVQLRLMQYVLLVLHVRTGFKAINDCLRKLLPEVTTKSNPHLKTVRRVVQAYTSTCGVVRNVDRSQAVRRAALAYTSTCGVVRDVDCSQGLTLLILLASYFLQLVVKGYYFILNFITPTDSQEFNHILYESEIFLTFCVFTLNLVTIIEPCHMTHKDMDTARELVSQLMLRTRRSVYDPLMEELEQFSKQMTLVQVLYKPFRLITISRALLLAILANVTTYLVILTSIK